MWFLFLLVMMSMVVAFINSLVLLGCRLFSKTKQTVVKRIQIRGVRWAHVGGWQLKILSQQTREPYRKEQISAGTPNLPLWSRAGQPWMDRERLILRPCRKKWDNMIILIAHDSQECQEHELWVYHMQVSSCG